MSAEVETGKEEDTTKELPKKPLKERFQEQWQLGIKILELIICCICMAFAYDSVRTTGLGKSHLHHVGIMYTAFTGFMLINTIMLISRSIGDRIPYRTTSMLALAGSAVFLVTGILLVTSRAYLMKRYGYHPTLYMITMLTTTICFSFVNVLVFAIDAIFTFRRQEDF